MKRITATEEQMMEKEAQRGLKLISQLERIERVLKWVAIELIHQRKWTKSALNTPYLHPDISDILKSGQK